MAFIYKYIFKNPTNRNNQDIRNYRISIEETIKQVFSNSFKDVLVEKDYFEFKLHLKAPDKKLKEMGRKLVKRDKGLNKIKRFTNSGAELFIKSDTEYYGYLEKYRKGKEDEFTLNFDVVKRFDSNDGKSLFNLDNINKREMLRKIDTYKISICIDIQKTNKKLREIIKNIKTNNWYLIKGKLSNSEHESEIFLDFTAFHRSDAKADEELISGFKIASIEKIEDSLENNLNKFFSLEGISYTEAPKFITEAVKQLKVIVYNVGQGLCSAICDKDEHPYIYFDFGRGYWRDRCTYPGGMSYDFTHNPKIILSHWDTDHYILINECKEAFNCEWITSNNIKGPAASKICAELSKRKNLTVISSKKDLVWGSIVVGNGSDKHKHNDGLSLLIEPKNNPKKSNNITKRCLLTGDNRYNVLPSHVLHNLDILLASHHGGTYNEICDGTNIPICVNDGIIIYSYGKHAKFLPYYNSHKHPSYIQHYKDVGWKNEVHTPDGSYIVDL